MNFLKKLLPFAKVILSGTPVAPLLSAVNALLPNDKALPATAAGQQLIDAYTMMPATHQAQLDDMAHTLEMEKQHTEQWRIMNEADATGNTVRPETVRLYARVTAGTVAGFIIFLFYACYGVASEDLPDVLKGLASMWTLVAGALGVLATPILRYFGARENEKTTRYAAITGSDLPVRPGLLGTLLGVFK